MTHLSDILFRESMLEPELLYEAIIWTRGSETGHLGVIGARFHDTDASGPLITATLYEPSITLENIRAHREAPLTVSLPGWGSLPSLLRVALAKHSNGPVDDDMALKKDENAPENGGGTLMWPADTLLTAICTATRISGTRDNAFQLEFRVVRVHLPSGGPISPIARRESLLLEAAVDATRVAALDPGTDRDEAVSRLHHFLEVLERIGPTDPGSLRLLNDISEGYEK